MEKIFMYGAHCPVDRIKDGLRVQVKPLGQSTVNTDRNFSVKRSPFLSPIWLYKSLAHFIAKYSACRIIKISRKSPKSTDCTSYRL